MGGHGASSGGHGTSSGGHDVVVIGAGPAGLICAITCARGGKRTLLLEKGPSAGRKLLISGAGQCNITHEGNVKEFGPRYGENGRFLRPALLNFSNTDLVELFRGLGVEMRENIHGKLFPDSMESMDVLDALLRECDRTGVRVGYDAAVRDVERAGAARTPGNIVRGGAASQKCRAGPGGSPARFIVVSAAGRHECASVVVATGGRSYPDTGSTGDGYAIARDMGHTVVPPRPALAPVHIANNPFADCARITFSDIGLSLFRNGRKVRSACGHMIFARLGLSGPVTFNLSCYTRPGDELRVHFIPVEDKDAFRARFMEELSEHASRSVRNILGWTGIPVRVISRVLELEGIPDGLRGSELTRKDRNRIVEALCAYPLPVKDIGDWGIAMVTAGGVALGEVDPKTMGSSLVPGLYFAGEVLDVDGDTGGYNIQAAFSTGKLAGDSIVKGR